MTNYTDEDLERMLLDSETDLAERKESLKGDAPKTIREYDVHPIGGVALDELDRIRFRSEYLPLAIDPEVLQANDRSEEQRLAATKMIASVDQLDPTVLGLLVIGKSTQDFLPGAYVQFLRIQGTELGDPIIDTENINGTIGDVIRQLDEKLIAHNRIGVDFTSGSLEKQFRRIP
jgi:ATP-dependent DNA helicase RecG